MRQARHDQAKGHAVDVDLVAAPLFGHGAGQPVDARLGRRVVGLACVAVHARGGRDVDHFAVLGRTGFGFFFGGLADEVGGRTQDAERRGQVHSEHGFPLLVAHLLQHVVPGVTGVVDDDVDAAKSVERGLDKTLAKVGVRYAADADHGLTTAGNDVGHRLLGRGLVEVVDDDACAFAGELECDFTANAATGAGDQGHLAFEFAGHENPF